MIYLLFYKGTKKENLFSTPWDRFICFVTRSRFSHVEISLHDVNNDYVCWSSSTRDGGVRKILVPKTSDNWVVVPVAADVSEVFFQIQNGKKYDYIGLLGTIIPLSIFSHKNKWFCSEIVAEAMGLERSWKHSPETLYKLCK